MPWPEEVGADSFSGQLALGGSSAAVGPRSQGAADSMATVRAGWAGSSLRGHHAAQNPAPLSGVGRRGHAEGEEGRGQTTERPTAAPRRGRLRPGRAGPCAAWPAGQSSSQTQAGPTPGPRPRQLRSCPPRTQPECCERQSTLLLPAPPGQLPLPGPSQGAPPLHLIHVRSTHGHQPHQASSGCPRDSLSPFSALFVPL